MDLLLSNNGKVLPLTDVHHLHCCYSHTQASCTLSKIKLLSIMFKILTNFIYLTDTTKNN